MEISKRDWKLFREYVPKWQTRYIGKLNREYIELLSGDGDASDHFWALEARIRKDKKHPGVSIEISKGNAVYDLVLHGWERDTSGRQETGSDLRARRA